MAALIKETEFYFHNDIVTIDYKATHRQRERTIIMGKLKVLTVLNRQKLSPQTSFIMVGLRKKIADRKLKLLPS